MPLRSDRLALQHFFCNIGYTPDACQRQIAIMKTAVARFPTDALGEWTWVLVRSQDWKRFWKMLKVDTNSPALTCLEKRETFIEEVLVADVPDRAKELIGLAHGHARATEHRCRT